MQITPNSSDARSVELTVGSSLFLDVVRLCAAFAVAVGHLSQVTVGWPNLIDYAVDAVTAFFVLSGFVIRYVTIRRRGTWRSYLSDRASRIYSVLLPAMVLAAFTDVAVRWLTQGHSLATAFHGHHLLIATLTNLTFTTYIWHQQWFYYTDGAMWSLCFEWAYYMLYGIAFYLVGWRRTLPLLFVGLIAGPEVLILFPIWLAGCLLFECFIRARRARWFLPSLSFALLCAVGLLLNSHLRLLANTSRLFFAEHFHSWQSHDQVAHSPFSFLLPRLGFGSPVSLNAYLWGAIFFVIMLLGLLLADRLVIDRDGRPARTLRLLAEATFPLYLFHLPIFLLADALFAPYLASNAAKLALLGFAFVLSVVLGEVLNRFKLVLRSWISAATNANRANSAAPAARP